MASYKIFRQSIPSHELQNIEANGIKARFERLQTTPNIATVFIITIFVSSVSACVEAEIILQIFYLFHFYLNDFFNRIFW